MGSKDAHGNLIDPYDGAADIARGIIRHVSDAFAEDPVRILRAAKFAARFASRGFRIAPETRDLMRQMVAAGEADALVPDRVWRETEAALAGPDPRVFFEALRACRALEALYPEINALFGVPQPPKWHPEVDTGVHTMMVLEQASNLSADVEVRFAALVHDLGKATTPADEWPSHAGHEVRGKNIIKAMSTRLPLPRACRDLGALVSEFHTHCHRAHELREKTVLTVLEKTDAFRRPERFAQFLLACKADARGRTSFESSDYPQADLMSRALKIAAAVDSAGIAAQHEAADIPKAIRQARIAALKSRPSAS